MAVAMGIGLRLAWLIIGDGVIVSGTRPVIFHINKCQGNTWGVEARNDIRSTSRMRKGLSSG